MKKFSKILTLILALVVIVTAFTVVALAAEPSYTNQKGHTVDSTFETFTVDARPFSRTGGAPTNGGIFIKEAYPGGNKYMLLQTSSGDAGETRTTTWVGSEYSRRTKYTFANYPTIAIDFDIMTPSGNWGLYDATNTTNSAGYYIRPYVGSALESSGRFNQVRFGQLGLSTTPYNWQHVTVVYEYYVAPVVINEETQETENHEFLKQSAYVNGVLTKEWPVIDHTAKGITNSQKFYVGPLYFQSGRYQSNGQVALDNIQFVYYEAGYDISKVPTTIYNENWKAPFGKLLATVTVGEEISYFDDLGKANEFAQANPGSKISLATNMTTPYYIDTELTIDANIYSTDDQGVTTITGQYTGVLEYARTTKGYYLEETAEGSGIYVSKMGEFDFIADGRIYKEAEFVSVVNDATKISAGSTIKLYKDITIDKRLSIKSADVTLDLNGYTINKVSYYGDVYNATGADGEFVKADTGISEDSTFAVYTKTGFKITSSNGRGAIYNASANADSYYRDGVLESRTIISYDYAQLLYHELSDSTVTIENIDVYSGNITNIGHGGRARNTYNVHNVRFYQTSAWASNNSTFAFYFHGGPQMWLNVTDSLFYFNDHAANMTSGLMRFNYAPNNAEKPPVATFTNCDIIANNVGGTADRVGVMNAGSPDNIVFDGCRVFQFESPEKVVAINGTVSNLGGKSNAYQPSAAAGWTNAKLAKSFTKTYTNVPSAYEFPKTDDAIQSIDLNIARMDYECTYTQITTKAVDVKLGDKTVSLMPGVSNIYDKEFRQFAPDTDNLLNSIYQWEDAQGNLVDKILGYTADGIVFDWNTTLTLTAADETKLVGGIEAEFNLGFLSGFRYNLYIPVDARLATVEIEGYAKGGTVLIGGVEYTVYSALVGTAAAAEDSTISATFEVDGVAYSQTWSISAVQYAEYLIANPSAQYPNETAALGNMVKFIKDAVLALDSTADVTELEAIIASAGVDAGYKTYTEGNASAFNALLENGLASVQFTVYNGVASYKFILDAEDTAFSATVHGEAIGFTADGTTIVLDAMRVYDIIDPITVTVGETTATVSILDYLTAQDAAGTAGMELAKSLYEFGVAADAYKQDIMAND